MVGDELSEFTRLARTHGLRTALWHVRRFLVWTVTQRLPISALARLFDLYGTVHPGRSDANPLRPVWVDPHAIEYYHPGEPKGFGEVAGGDWDRDACRFEELAEYRSLERRFRDGVAWEETALFERYRRRLADGNPFWRCRTEAELEAYFAEIDRLYERIEREGYRSQRQLLAADPERTRQWNNDAMHPALNEVSINVFRDGGMAKSESGNHRLAIAKLLDVEEIPVVVRARHAEWQALRDEIGAAESPDDLTDRAVTHLGHPDLADVVPPDWLA